MGRNRLRAVVLAAALVAAPAASGNPITIGWGDLIPDHNAASPLEEMMDQLGGTPQPGAVRGPVTGIVQHGQMTEIPRGREVVSDFNGKTVSLSGFVIPLNFTAKGTTSFMLVPFVGACIHVPPPPPNQLVFVTTEEPLRVSGLFEPFTVTGELNTATTKTELAEVGYVMKANRILPYR